MVLRAMSVVVLLPSKAVLWPIGIASLQGTAALYERHAKTFRAPSHNTLGLGLRTSYQSGSSPIITSLTCPYHGPQQAPQRHQIPTARAPDVTGPTISDILKSAVVQYHGDLAPEGVKSRH